MNIDDVRKHCGDGKYVELIYDIPDQSGIANPSAKLRKRGFRINLSCWIFQTGHLPVDYIETLIEKGADVEVLPFTLETRETVLRLAKKAMDKEVGEIRALLSEAVAKASTKYDEAKRLESADLVLKADTYFKGRLREAKKKLADANACALHFDVLGDIEAVFKGLSSSIAAEQEGHDANRAAEAKKIRDDRRLAKKAAKNKNETITK